MATAALAGLFVVLALNFVTPEKQVERVLVHRHGVRDAQFLREMGSLLGPAILPGNRVADLENGDEIFPAMLEAIRGARRSIAFETYIYWSGAVGVQFAGALAERAQAGVPVLVLLDWAGSAKMDRELLETMERAGVEVRRYHPLRWYHLARMNNRTHRKLLIVDGRLAFTGGVGIADVWSGRAQDPDHWRDCHFRFEGPVVAQAQSVFLDNWIKTTGVVLQGERYFPALAAGGPLHAQMFSSSPTGGSESMQLMYLLAIAAAEQTIDLSAAYFVPDDLTTSVLVAAVRRGVRVRIIVPGREIDSPIVRHASRGRWGPFLEVGVLLYEYVPTMYHCKIMVVDQRFVSVGSTNFDNRSFRLNDEASLNVYDQSFGERMTTVFEADLERARRITLETWQARPAHEKIRDWLAGRLASQL